MAIHDAAYARPARTFDEFRWRLQHLSEERFGHRARRGVAAEDAAFASAAERLG